MSRPMGLVYHGMSGYCLTHLEWEVRSRLSGLCWDAWKRGLKLGCPVWTWLPCDFLFDLGPLGQEHSELGCLVCNYLVSAWDARLV